MVSECPAWAFIRCIYLWSGSTVAFVNLRVNLQWGESGKQQEEEQEGGGARIRNEGHAPVMMWYWVSTVGLKPSQLSDKD